MRAEVRGEIESDQGVLVIRRVHVHYLLDGAEQVLSLIHIYVYKRQQQSGESPKHTRRSKLAPVAFTK